MFLVCKSCDSCCRSLSLTVSNDSRRVCAVSQLIQIAPPGPARPRPRGARRRALPARPARAAHAWGAGAPSQLKHATDRSPDACQLGASTSACHNMRRSRHPTYAWRRSRAWALGAARPPCPATVYDIVLSRPATMSLTLLCLVRSPRASAQSIDICFVHPPDDLF